MQKIADAVLTACETEHKPYRISVCSGFCVCDDPSVPPAQYLKDADSRMYRNKEAYYRTLQEAH